MINRAAAPIPTSVPARRFRLRRAVARFKLWWAGSWPWRYGSSLQFWPGRLLRRSGVLADEWVRFADGLSVEIDSRNVIHKFLVRDGRFAAPIYDEIVRSVGPDGVFVDVGANFGYFSVLAGTRTTAGHVLAVEANPAYARKLAEHVARNNSTGIEIFQVACWDEDGTLDLFVAGIDNPGKTSLSSANAYSSELVRVPACPLDSIVEESGVDKVDLIKVDVEGAELHVLDGMQRTIERFRPRVIVEVEDTLLAQFSASPGDIHEYFARHGYRSETLSATDILFVPR